MGRLGKILLDLPLVASDHEDLAERHKEALMLLFCMLDLGRQQIYKAGFSCQRRTFDYSVPFHGWYGELEMHVERDPIETLYHLTLLGRTMALRARSHARLTILPNFPARALATESKKEERLATFGCDGCRSSDSPCQRRKTLYISLSYDTHRFRLQAQSRQLLGRPRDP